MNKELTEKLWNEFPLTYSNKISFGHDDGWYDIVYEMSAKIEAVLQEQSYKDTQVEPLFVMRQIKQKFATLTVYYNNNCSDKEIEDAVEEAYQKSKKTCEICGKEGKVSGQRYIRTLCDAHGTSFNFN